MKLYQNAAQIFVYCFVAIQSTLIAGQDKELGQVDWLRNYDGAVEKSQSSGKPILILFQEVPGCAGCVQYGETTLSHPLIVDAIEAEFVPLAIHNNAGGHDKEILKRFKEPAWNFQVMRFIDTEGNDLIERKDRVWTPRETAARMIEALEAAERRPPEYLRTVAWASAESEVKTAFFSMHCFWDGEAKLGAIEGVNETEAGWIDGHEVVRVVYGSKLIEWRSLVEQARAHGCAKQIYAPDAQTFAETPEQFGAFTDLYVNKSFRSARSSDQKRHLQASKFRDLRLNSMQRTKINSALSLNDTGMILKWLSPMQSKKFM